LIKALDLFPADDVARARRYHRPLYAALLVDLALGFGTLAALAFTPVGDWLWEPFDGLPWWAAALLFAPVVVLASTLVRLPLSYWRGYLHERQWGFSTQELGGWLVDRAKAFGVGAVLTTAFLFGLAACVHALPSAWPLVAAPGAALLVGVLSFVAPVAIEPLFNRFRPLADAALAADLRSLAELAGVPVRDVLVADASRRTRKANAYVSGLGRTRRVVVYDTLLEQSDPRQVRLVVAHELGHRRKGHVLKSTLVLMAGFALSVLVLWAVVDDPGDPRNVPLVLLVSGALQLVSLPFGAALSRRWERAADRFSIELTHDPDAFERTQRDLARSNLSDLEPPRALYLLLFTHPTAPERIATARAATVG
jgi:STE24 endopeptidase